MRYSELNVKAKERAIKEYLAVFRDEVLREEDAIATMSKCDNMYSFKEDGTLECNDYTQDIEC